MNCAFTLWKGNNSGVAKLLGHPMRRGYDGTVVKLIAKTAKVWRLQDISRVGNMMTLPSFEVMMD